MTRGPSRKTGPAGSSLEASNMNGGATAAGSSRAYRLDPLSLPARPSITSAGHGKRGVHYRPRARDRPADRRVCAGGHALRAARQLRRRRRAHRARRQSAAKSACSSNSFHVDPALTLCPGRHRRCRKRSPPTGRNGAASLNLPLLGVAPDGTVTAPRALARRRYRRAGEAPPPPLVLRRPPPAIPGATEAGGAGKHRSASRAHGQSARSPREH